MFDVDDLGGTSARDKIQEGFRLGVDNPGTQPGAFLNIIIRTLVFPG